VSLSFYLQDTRSLLRDSNSLFLSDQQLTRWVNQGRSQVAKRTSCLRALVSGQSSLGNAAQPGFMIPGAIIPGIMPGATANGVNIAGNVATVTGTFNAIPGVERYPYEYANPLMRASEAGLKKVINVLQVSVSWGAARPAMNWLPWEDLQAYARSYNFGVTSYPYYWSCTNEGENGQVWLFPVPSQGGINGEMEWDTFCTPSDLNSDSDYDAIPDGFQSAVKYYAAGLSYYGSGRMGQARLMMDLFADDLGIARFATDQGKVAEWYWTAP
jgi:hypothetical protein